MAEYVTVHNPDGTITKEEWRGTDRDWWMARGMTAEQADLQVRMVTEAETARAEVMTARMGDEVMAPRGGMPGILRVILPDGTRLITEDGEEIVPEDWCKHEHPAGRYFEYVGGPHDGSHGWYDAHDTCRRVFQWG